MQVGGGDARQLSRTLSTVLGGLCGEHYPRESAVWGAEACGEHSSQRSSVGGQSREEAAMSPLALASSNCSPPPPHSSGT